MKKQAELQSKNDLAKYLFLEGTNYEAYKYLGAHRDKSGYVFRVWAPNADAVYLVGDFNNWSDDCPMTLDSGIWECRLGGDRFSVGSKYKYKIVRGERELFKADPYGTYAELPPETASVYYDIDGYRWHDTKWMDDRKAKKDVFYNCPMNIYEVHAGSWKKNADGSYYTYKQLTEELIPYVKDMGYTHIELMPIAEHPFDGSWGYQVCGYFAPTSRFGTPHDFMAFVDAAHRAGIGVILDWVPAHFPKDAHGLYEFDGAPLYEFQGADRMEHKSWGTRCFDVGRNEVQCFLVSNVAYWAKEYHIDGIRVDAVASMLYLDYDRRPGEWNPNIYGTNRSLEAISFFKKLNSYMCTEFPDVLMIAEESTAWENVTRFDGDGLGFNMKWNMGWMNDALSYAETDPLFRKGNHNKVTFSMMYAFAERYVLPISHDEVVHGKKSLLDRFPGLYGQKFDGMRAFLIYMFCHPGKKLLFMGSENGQFAEWNYEKEVEWFMLENEQHAKLHAFVRDLNRLYLKHSELWELDDTWDGFEWVEVNNADESILALRRKNKKGESLLALINFTPVERENHLVPVPPKASYSVLLDSMDEKYGGYKKTTHSTRAKKNADGTYTIRVNLPAHGAIIFKEKTK
ncbi:MAG: 1,4-alpha-glucan branching protein GlgB [Clostridia bacterium]|nr:1,4-alpha-glucan branching protein GlgB [Clostridia bacterium]